MTIVLFAYMMRILIVPLPRRAAGRPHRQTDARFYSREDSIDHVLWVLKRVEHWNYSAAISVMRSIVLAWGNNQNVGIP
jgi:hypothetical protein